MTKIKRASKFYFTVLIVLANKFKIILDIIVCNVINLTFPCRDLGEHLRKQVQAAFAARQFDTNQEECDKKYLALKRIAEDHHLKAHPRTLKSCATGLTAEQCNQILSPEFLEALEREDQGVFRRVFSFGSKK